MIKSWNGGKYQIKPKSVPRRSCNGVNANEEQIDQVKRWAEDHHCADACRLFIKKYGDQGKTPYAPKMKESRFRHYFQNIKGIEFASSRVSKVKMKGQRRRAHSVKTEYWELMLWQ